MKPPRKAPSIHLQKGCKEPVLTGQKIPFGDEVLDIDDLLTRAYENSLRGDHYTSAPYLRVPTQMTP